MIGVYPFRVGDEIRVSVRASVTTPVKLFARVRYVDGGDDLIEIDITHSAGDRTNELKRSSDLFKKAGWVEHLTVDTVLANARGRFYMMVAINRKPHHFPIAAGYIDVPHVPLGEFEPAIGGSGYLSWLTIENDVAPVASLVTSLAAPNARRIIWGFIKYYHASSDVATRGVVAVLRNIGPAQPTGMTEGTKTRQWINTDTISLTADEEGLLYVYGRERPAYEVTNDDGILIKTNTSTEYTPFPFEVLPEDNGELEFIVSNGEVNDRVSSYILVEEWISP